MSLFAAFFIFIVAFIAVVAASAVCYLLALLLSAAIARRQSHARANSIPASTQPVSFAVVVPAHNEELVLAATIASLQAQDYPAGLFEIVVLADNCTDTTADIARAGGVTVIERTHATERGKGYALAEAMRQLLRRPQPADAFVIVDADTWVAPDFLIVMSAHLQERRDALGRAALQGRYGVLNADEGWRAALMAGAFDLFNHIKPLGRDRLGLSVGLKGNGMAFTRPLMEVAPFSGASITEDIDYGLDLLRHHGVRVGYAPDALVRAQMPTSAAQAASQRERWEGGRYKLLRHRAIPLLGEGIRRRNPILVDAAVDLMLPPLSEMAALLFVLAILIGAGALMNVLPFWPLWMGACALLWLGLIAYILGGFHVADAPKEVYMALLKAPGYVLWKAVIYAAMLFKKRRSATTPSGTDEWVRTERTAIPVGPPPSSEEKPAPR